MRPHAPSTTLELSPDEAKRILLEWGARADAELANQAASALHSVQDSAKRVIPWAAAGAAGVGLFSRILRGKSKPRAKSSLIGTLFHLGMDVLPVVTSMMKTKR